MCNRCMRAQEADKDKNGYLDLDEFQACIRNSGLDLSAQQVPTQRDRGA